MFPIYEALSDGTCSCGKPACSDEGKHPRCEHGFKDATTDRAQIQAWWQRWPNANIGIACGAAGWVVIDVDLEG